MNDWTKQAEDMFKAWSDSQKTILDNWAETMKSMGKTQETVLWEKSLATWEETMKKTLKAQEDWTRSWVDSLKSIEGTPAQVVESVDRFAEMSQRWTQTQDEMISNWFEMLKGFDPSKMTGRWTEAFQNPMQAWQQATKKVIEAQADWLQTWTKSGKGSGKD